MIDLSKLHALNMRSLVEDQKPFLIIFRWLVTEEFLRPDLIEKITTKKFFIIKLWKLKSIGEIYKFQDREHDKLEGGPLKK